MSTKRIKSTASHQLSGNPQPRFKKIVIINDNDLEQFICKAFFQEISKSLEVKHERNPFHLISELKKTDLLSEIPDLIFLDLKLENIDGFSFLEEFTHLSDFARSKCKIIIVTSQDYNEDKFRILLNTSVIRLLIRPVDVVQIKDIIYS